MSDYLPREDLINILTRLPAKTLLRFRCVCRSWLSLLTSPDFTSAHLQAAAAAKPPILLLRCFSLAGTPPRYKELYSIHRSDDADDFTSSLTDLRFPFKTRSGCFFRVVGCCNGVVCLSDDLFGYTYTVILWNPAIRRYLTLPMPNISFEDYGPYMFALGFGFDPKTNDHKVVRIVYLEGSGKVKGWAVPPKVEVYALSTGVWKTINGSKIGYHMVEFFWSSAFANDGVHWMAYTGGRSMGYCNVVLVFDVGTEVFREFKLPEKLVDESPLNLVVASYRDSISVFHYDNRGPYSCEGFTIWVMNEYGVKESWMKLFTCSLKLNDGVSAVLGFWNGDKVAVENWVGKLVSCQQGRVKEMGLTGGKESFYLGKYAESLILLDGGNDVPAEEVVPSDGVEDSAKNYADGGNDDLAEEVVPSDEVEDSAKNYVGGNDVLDEEVVTSDGVEDSGTVNAAVLCSLMHCLFKDSEEVVPSDEVEDSAKNYVDGGNDVLDEEDVTSGGIEDSGTVNVAVRFTLEDNSLMHYLFAACALNP